MSIYFIFDCKVSTAFCRKPEDIEIDANKFKAKYFDSLDELQRVACTFFGALRMIFFLICGNIFSDDQ